MSKINSKLKISNKLKLKVKGLQPKHYIQAGAVGAAVIGGSIAIGIVLNDSNEYYLPNLLASNDELQAKFLQYSGEEIKEAIGTELDWKKHEDLIRIEHDDFLNGNKVRYVFGTPKPNVANSNHSEGTSLEQQEADAISALDDSAGINKNNDEEQNYIVSKILTFEIKSDKLLSVKSADKKINSTKIITINEKLSNSGVSVRTILSNVTKNMELIKTLKAGISTTFEEAVFEDTVIDKSDKTLESIGFPDAFSIANKNTTDIYVTKGVGKKVNIKVSFGSKPLEFEFEIEISKFNAIPSFIQLVDEEQEKLNKFLDSQIFSDHTVDVSSISASNITATEPHGEKIDLDKLAELEAKYGIDLSSYDFNKEKGYYLEVYNNAAAGNYGDLDWDGKLQFKIQAAFMQNGVPTFTDAWAPPKIIDKDDHREYIEFLPEEHEVNITGITLHKVNAAQEVVKTSSITGNYQFDDVSWDGIKNVLITPTLITEYDIKNLILNSDFEYRISIEPDGVSSDTTKGKIIISVNKNSIKSTTSSEFDTLNIKGLDLAKEAKKLEDEKELMQAMIDSKPTIFLFEKTVAEAIDKNITSELEKLFNHIPVTGYEYFLTMDPLNSSGDTTLIINIKAVSSHSYSKLGSTPVLATWATSPADQAKNEVEGSSTNPISGTVYVDGIDEYNDLSNEQKRINNILNASNALEQDFTIEKITALNGSVIDENILNLLGLDDTGTPLNLDNANYSYKIYIGTFNDPSDPSQGADFSKNVTKDGPFAIKIEAIYIDGNGNEHLATPEATVGQIIAKGIEGGIFASLEQQRINAQAHVFNASGEKAYISEVSVPERSLITPSSSGDMPSGSQSELHADTSNNNYAIELLKYGIELAINKNFHDDDPNAEDYKNFAPRFKYTYSISPLTSNGTLTIEIRVWIGDTPNLIASEKFSVNIEGINETKAINAEAERLSALSSPTIKIDNIEISTITNVTIDSAMATKLDLLKILDLTKFNYKISMPNTTADGNITAKIIVFSKNSKNSHESEEKDLSLTVTGINNVKALLAEQKRVQALILPTVTKYIELWAAETNINIVAANASKYGLDTGNLDFTKYTYSLSHAEASSDGTVTLKIVVAAKDGSTNYETDANINNGVELSVDGINITQKQKAVDDIAKTSETTVPGFTWTVDEAALLTNNLIVTPGTKEQDKLQYIPISKPQILTQAIVTQFGLNITLDSEYDYYYYTGTTHHTNSLESDDKINVFVKLVIKGKTFSETTGPVVSVFKVNVIGIDEVVSRKEVGEEQERINKLADATSTTPLLQTIDEEKISPIAVKAVLTQAIITKYNLGIVLDGSFTYKYLLKIPSGANAGGDLDSDGQIAIEVYVSQGKIDSPSIISTFSVRVNGITKHNYQTDVNNEQQIVNNLSGSGWVINDITFAARTGEELTTVKDFSDIGITFTPKSGFIYTMDQPVLNYDQTYRLTIKVTKELPLLAGYRPIKEIIEPTIIPHDNVSVVVTGINAVKELKAEQELVNGLVAPSIVTLIKDDISVAGKFEKVTDAILTDSIVTKYGLTLTLKAGYTYTYSTDTALSNNGSIEFTIKVTRGSTKVIATPTGITIAIQGISEIAQKKQLAAEQTRINALATNSASTPNNYEVDDKKLATIATNTELTQQIATDLFGSTNPLTLDLQTYTYSYSFSGISANGNINVYVVAHRNYNVTGSTIDGTKIDETVTPITFTVNVIGINRAIEKEEQIRVNEFFGTSAHPKPTATFTPDVTDSSGTLLPAKEDVNEAAITTWTPLTSSILSDYGMSDLILNTGLFTYQYQVVKITDDSDFTLKIKVTSIAIINTNTTAAEEVPTDITFAATGIIVQTQKWELTTEQTRINTLATNSITVPITYENDTIQLTSVADSTPLTQQIATKILALDLDLTNFTYTYSFSGITANGDVKIKIVVHKTFDLPGDPINGTKIPESVTPITFTVNVIGINRAIEKEEQIRVNEFFGTSAHPKPTATFTPDVTDSSGTLLPAKEDVNEAAITTWTPLTSSILSDYGMSDLILNTGLFTYQYQVVKITDDSDFTLKIKVTSIAIINTNTTAAEEVPTDITFAATGFDDKFAEWELGAEQIRINNIAELHGTDPLTETSYAAETEVVIYDGSTLIQAEIDKYHLIDLAFKTGYIYKITTVKMDEDATYKFRVIVSKTGVIAKVSDTDINYTAEGIDGTILYDRLKTAILGIDGQTYSAISNATTASGVELPVVAYTPGSGVELTTEIATKYGLSALLTPTFKGQPITYYLTGPSDERASYHVVDADNPNPDETAHPTLTANSFLDIIKDRNPGSTVTFYYSYSGSIIDGPGTFTLHMVVTNAGVDTESTATATINVTGIDATKATLLLKAEQERVNVLSGFSALTTESSLPAIPSGTILTLDLIAKYGITGITLGADGTNPDGYIYKITVPEINTDGNVAIEILVEKVGVARIITWITNDGTAHDITSPDPIAIDSAITGLDDSNILESLKAVLDGITGSSKVVRAEEISATTDEPLNTTSAETLGITLPASIRGATITYSHALITADGDLSVEVKVSKTTTYAGLQEINKTLIIAITGINETKETLLLKAEQERVNALSSFSATTTESSLPAIPSGTILTPDLIAKYGITGITLGADGTNPDGYVYKITVPEITVDGNVSIEILVEKVGVARVITWTTNDGTTHNITSPDPIVIDSAITGLDAADLLIELNDLLNGITGSAKEITAMEIAAAAEGTPLNTTSAETLGITLPADIKGTTITYSHALITADGDLSVEVKISGTGSTTYTGTQEVKKTLIIAITGIDAAKIKKDINDAKVYIDTLANPTKTTTAELNVPLVTDETFDEAAAISLGLTIAQFKELTDLGVTMTYSHAEWTSDGDYTVSVVISKGGGTDASATFDVTVSGLSNATASEDIKNGLALFATAVSATTTDLEWTSIASGTPLTTTLAAKLGITIPAGAAPLTLTVQASGITADGDLLVTLSAIKVGTIIPQSIIITVTVTGIDEANANENIKNAKTSMEAAAKGSITVTVDKMDAIVAGTTITAAELLSEYGITMPTIPAGVTYTIEHALITSDGDLLITFTLNGVVNGSNATNTITATMITTITGMDKVDSANDIKDILNTFTDIGFTTTLAEISSVTNGGFGAAEAAALGITLPSDGKGVILTYSHALITSDGDLSVTINAAKGDADDSSKIIVISLLGLTAADNTVIINSVFEPELNLPTPSKTISPNTVTQPSDGITTSGVGYEYTKWEQNTDGTIGWEVTLTKGTGDEQGTAATLSGTLSGYKTLLEYQTALNVLLDAKIIIDSKQDGDENDLIYNKIAEAISTAKTSISAATTFATTDAANTDNIKLIDTAISTYLDSLKTWASTKFGTEQFNESTETTSSDLNLLYTTYTGVVSSAKTTVSVSTITTINEFDTAYLAEKAKIEAARDAYLDAFRTAHEDKLFRKRMSASGTDEAAEWSDLNTIQESYKAAISSLITVSEIEAYDTADIVTGKQTYINKVIALVQARRALAISQLPDAKSEMTDKLTDQNTEAHAKYEAYTAAYEVAKTGSVTTAIKAASSYEQIATKAATIDDAGKAEWDEYIAAHTEAATLYDKWELIKQEKADLRLIGYTGGGDFHNENGNLRGPTSAGYFDGDNFYYDISGDIDHYTIWLHTTAKLRYLDPNQASGGNGGSHPYYPDIWNNVSATWGFNKENEAYAYLEWFKDHQDAVNNNFKYLKMSTPTGDVLLAFTNVWFYLEGGAWNRFNAKNGVWIRDDVSEGHVWPVDVANFLLSGETSFNGTTSITTFEEV